MTPEEQNRVIAEACGWREAFPKVGPPHPETKRGGILLPYTWVNENTHKRCQELPDYLNDLNAMHEAEKILACATEDDPKPWESYMRQLSGLLYEELPQHLRTGWHDNEIFGEWLETTAGAAQRAEAFLKTIGKWK